MALAGLPPAQPRPAVALAEDSTHRDERQDGEPQQLSALNGIGTNGHGGRPAAPADAASPDHEGEAGEAPFSVSADGLAGGLPAGLIDPAVLNGEADPSGTELQFIEFCRGCNPVGDMRRVVVAAEGAQRFLGVSSVDQHALDGLFALAGWPRPHSLVQTLRNAARAKFQWLERVPGRLGFYTVTDTGLQTALPDPGSAQTPGFG